VAPEAEAIQILLTVNEIKTSFIAECCEMKIDFGYLKRICVEVVR